MAEELEIRNNVVTGSLKWLTHVEIPAGVTAIGAGAFRKVRMRTITIPPGLREVGAEAFRDCGNLGEVTFPPGLERIGDHAFAGCKNLTALYLPAGLRSIGESALAGCAKLKKLVLPDTLEVLGDRALDGVGARELVLPASLRVLGTGAFRRSEIRRLVMLGKLPEGMKTLSLSRLGITALSAELQADRIPMEQISDTTRNFVLWNFVQRWSAGDSIPEEARKDRLEYIRRRQKDLLWNKEIQNILLVEKLLGPQDMEGFMAEARKANDTELMARLLEYQEKHIDREEQARLEEKKFKEELRALTRPEPTMQELKRMWPGCVLEDGSWMIRGYWNELDTTGEVTVPASLKKLPVTTIAAWAFSPEAKGKRQVVRDVLNKLRRVQISEGIRTIQEYAFYGCASLEWVRLPEGLEELPEGIFWNCWRLKAVEFPSTLKRIRANCFCGCESLRQVALPEGLEELGDQAFYGCKKLRSVRLPRSLRSIGAEAFRSCSVLKNVEVEPGGHLERMGKEAFRDCRGLEEIGILAGLKSLPQKTFWNCKKLQSVILPEGLAAVEKRAFLGCGKLRELVLPDSVTEIGEDAFPDDGEFCIAASPLSCGAQWAREHGVKLRETEPARPGEA